MLVFLLQKEKEMNILHSFSKVEIFNIGGVPGLIWDRVSERISNKTPLVKDQKHNDQIYKEIVVVFHNYYPECGGCWDCAKSATIFVPTEVIFYLLY